MRRSHCALHRSIENSRILLSRLAKLLSDCAVPPSALRGLLEFQHCAGKAVKLGFLLASLGSIILPYSLPYKFNLDTRVICMLDAILRSNNNRR
jgi:hypothetical protein